MRETLEAIHTYPWEFAGLSLVIVIVVATFGDAMKGIFKRK